MQREPVLQTMHSPGVLGDVTADGAGDLRRRVRRIEHAVQGRRLGDRKIAYAGLNDCAAAKRIDSENAVEFGERQEDAMLVRRGAAGQAGACPARNDRHPCRVTEP